MAVLLSLLLLVLNLRFYTQPGPPLPHLAYLRGRLVAGSGQEMQRLFPEGYFFSYVLYGLSWGNLARRHPELRGQALEEAQWALKALDSEAGRAPFSEHTDPPLGVFYHGWTGWLEGGILLLGGEAPHFDQRCADLGRAFSRSEEPFLDAYPGQSWPCDSTVAMAALTLHDRLREPKYAGVRTRWLEQVGERLDPETGLFPHRFRPGPEGARATSQTILLRFLEEIDGETSDKHYRRFRARFVTTRFGLPAVAEYPGGSSGPGDVDSGHLVAGVSFSATGVAPGAAALHGDECLRGPLARTIEVFGLSTGNRYLFGALPVADGLLVWSRTVTRWGPQRPSGAEFEPVVGDVWLAGFHLASLVLVLLAWLPVWLLRALRPGA